MTDYDLTQLSSRSFEQLLQALATKVLGPTIGVFGDGPDGGREITFNGKVGYPSIDDGWNGYGVLQVKFRQRTGDIAKDGDWAVEQLKSEIKKYFDPDKEYRRPEYFIYATNVVLTPVNEVGSKDRVEAILSDFKERLSLKGYDVWDYDKIRVFLDNNHDVRRTYAAWITPGDVLSEILEQLTFNTSNIQDIVYNFLQKELLSDEFVNLEQAGHDVSERIPLAQVFVDLPIVDELFGTTVEDQHLYSIDDLNSSLQGEGFIKNMLAVSAERLDPKSSDAIAQRAERRDHTPSRGKFVLIGGPGQGKTTVGQFICQIFRASIISRRSQVTVSSETRRALTSIERHCAQEGIDESLVPRFPFRIVLNEFASVLSSDSFPNITSVLSFMVYQIKKRTDYELSVNDLRDFLANYPSVIIFDGLDEVPSSSNRDQVLEAIRDFWVDASNANADTLSIATSRPQGYNEDFAPTFYRHHRLAPLSKELGQHFARRLVDVRYGSDVDRKEKILGRLARSFDNEATSRLMRSPLQVTIMTALVDRMGQPPQARWNLFKAYYDVIYQREVERDIPASSILRQYQPDINAIHNRVGLLLQIDSEQSGRTDAKFSTQRFMSLVEKRLEEEGHEGDSLKNLTREILEAAAERLVFLVGLEADRVGFEIRSLQEFMAAESLMEGSDNDVQRRLLEIAPLPNWRNVFLFASGKCFGERQHLRETIHSICATLNETGEDEVAGKYLVGSGLAMDLLEDGLARHQPRFVHSLTRIAIRALDIPNENLQLQLASIYETQLQPVYIEEMARRLKDPRVRVRLGTWNCLSQLVARDVAWAQQLADENWPSDPDAQIRILQASLGFWMTKWSAAKFLDLLPHCSIGHLREIYDVGRTVPYDDNSIRRKHSGHRKDLKLLPHEEAMLKVLANDDIGRAMEMEFLGDRYYGLWPAIVAQDDNSWHVQLEGLSDCHPSWFVYKSAARFLRTPSSHVLARELRSIAPLLNSEERHPKLWVRSPIPWPMAACLNVCDTEEDVINLARRVDAGQLGDLEIWSAAEHRWRTVGITEHDIRSMSDERLPFDSGIEHEGFPIGLSTWPVVRLHSEESDGFSHLLHLYREAECQIARGLIADMLVGYLVGCSMFIPSNNAKYPIAVHVEDLQAIFEDISPSHPIPLHSVLNAVFGPDQEIVEFFRAMQDQRFEFAVYPILGVFHSDGLERLGKAFANGSDSQSLIPVFGALAEHGQLPFDPFDGRAPQNHVSLELKAASILIMLAQEEWKVDRTDALMSHLNEAMAGQSPNNTLVRIMNALDHNRAAGHLLERFLLELGKLLPADHELEKRHTLLLGNALKRRKSRFADAGRHSNFNMPMGVTELLL